IAVVVGRAQTDLHQLAERVELLGDELTGANHADSVWSVRCLHLFERPGHRLQGVRPGHALPTTVLTLEWVARPVVRSNCVVLGQTLRTEHSAIDWMIRIAADCHRPSVANSDEHAAAHRTVTARRRDPALGGGLR